MLMNAVPWEAYCALDIKGEVVRMWRLVVCRIMNNTRRVALAIFGTGRPLINKVLMRLEFESIKLITSGSAEYTAVSIGGIKLRLPVRFVPHYVLHEYESVTRDMFVRTLRPGMKVVDIGAHIGVFTALAGKCVGPDGQVWSVEPAQDNLYYLRHNVMANGLHNVVIHPYAAGSDSRMRSFQMTGSSDSHGFYAHPLIRTIEIVEVEQRPVDDLVDGIADVVKLDVEGAEIEVLKGMSGILRQNPRLVLCVEWNPACMAKAGQDPMELLTYLGSQGFDSIVVLDDLGGRARELDEVVPLVRSGRLPDSWYVNLWARRGQ